VSASRRRSLAWRVASTERFVARITIGDSMPKAAVSKSRPETRYRPAPGSAPIRRRRPGVWSGPSTATSRRAMCREFPGVEPGRAALFDPPPVMSAAVQPWLAVSNGVDFQHLRRRCTIFKPAHLTRSAFGEHAIEYCIDTSSYMQHGRISGTNVFRPAPAHRASASIHACSRARDRHEFLARLFMSLASSRVRHRRAASRPARPGSRDCGTFVQRLLGERRCPCSTQSVSAAA